METRQREAHGMPPRDRANLDSNNATGHNARGADSSCTSPPPGRAGASRTLSSETASLHSVRKRASFFGRSSSDASSMRRAPATSHSAKSSLSAGRPDSDAPRPATSSSSGMRRRKTDPLQSIRDSIFGGKKKASQDALDASSSRPPSRGNEHLFQNDSANAQNFGSGEEYYRHLRKHTISPPFDFQHVTHTARNQLPQLETVDEKDLPGQFWSVAAHQRPRRRVQGIKVDDLEARHRQMGLIVESPEPSPAFSPPTSPENPRSPLLPTLEIPRQSAAKELRLISPITPVSPFQTHLPDTLPEQQDESKPVDNHSPPTSTSSSFSDPAAEGEARHIKQPQHNLFVDTSASNGPTLPQEQLQEVATSTLRSQESFYDSHSSSESEARKISPKRTTKPANVVVPKLNASMPPNFSQEYDAAFRAKQPLPVVPPQSVTAINSSPAFLQVTRADPVSMLSPTLPPAKPTSPASKRSSRSSRSAKSSPAFSRSPADLRNASMFSVSDVSWEDSVDLAYEEEAESTCDFAWAGAQQKRKSVCHRSDSKRDSAATISTSNSPNLSNPSESVTCFHANGSTDTVADRKGVDPKRQTSVGHRGFLAARKNSSTPDLLTKAKEPPASLSFSQSSTQVSTLSPVFSVADEDAQKTPFTPVELHYPHIERVSNDYLSDPESYRNSNSSKHRKSSSYGSYGSYDSAGTRAGPPNSNSNTTRWSIASSGSIPELMHSRPKSKSSLSRSVVQQQQPLETLPQSPPGSGEESEFKNTPRSQSDPSRSSYIRRSGASSEHVMQATGRAVQRGRPGSYARYSQHLEPQAPPNGGVRESWVTGPDWI